MPAAAALMPWGCRPAPRGRVFWITLVLVLWLMLGPLAPAPRRKPLRRPNWYPLEPEEPNPN